MLEFKYAPLRPIGLDAPSVEGGPVGALAGYAALFNIADQSGDVIAPGAFLNSLAGRETPVKMLWQHDPAKPIGVWEKLVEDDRGLRAEGRLCLDCQAGAEAAALLKAGALDGLSIGYRVVQAEQTDAGRRLTEVDLWEISLVTFPMSEAARAEPTAPKSIRPSLEDGSPSPAAVITHAILRAREALR
ncbi:MAG: HK97 family phage prohead protease [Pseudomonadota bacterium]